MARGRSYGLVVAAVLAAAPASAEPWTIPVPATTIYPRDVIRDDMVADRTWDQRPASAPSYVEDRKALIGKVARATLLPGQPILNGAVEPPKLVALGAQVRIVFEQGGVTIVTYGAALQTGAEGDLVRVRNTDSGLVVSGTVQADGSVRVGDG